MDKAKLLNFNWRNAVKKNKNSIKRYKDSEDIRLQYIKHVDLLNKIFSVIDHNKEKANKYMINLLENIAIHNAKIDTGPLINARLFKNGPANAFLSFQVITVEDDGDPSLSTEAYHNLLIGCTEHYDNIFNGKLSEAHLELDLHLRDLVSFIHSKKLDLEGVIEQAEVDKTLPAVPEDYNPADDKEWYTVHIEEKNNNLKILIVHKGKSVMQTVTNVKDFSQDYFSLMLQLNTSISSGARNSFFLTFSTPMKKFILDNNLRLNKLENNQFSLIDSIDISLKVTDPSVYFVLINDNIKDVSQIFNT